MANFAKKLDLDNHVLNYRARLKSDFERKLRAKNFAKLYYLNKEYSKASRYLTEFMSVKNDCPAAFKLQGKIQEALLERDNAVQSFMKSLELDQSQTDLFDKIMELIPYTNLEPDKVKLWTERLQLAKKDSDFLERTKICSPCSSPGNITMDILNNSINDPGTPASLKNLVDLNLTGRSDDVASTPKSTRFVSPKAVSPFAAKVNFEKIEKELIVLSQAQEGIVTSVDKLQNEISKANSEIIEHIKGLQRNLEKFNLSVSHDISKNLSDIKETVNKHSEMMDKMMKSQVNLEDAVYELAESYGAQGDGAAEDEDNPTTNQSEYTTPDTFSSNPASKVGPGSDSKPNIFSRLDLQSSTGFNFQPPSNPSFSNSPYIPISPPAAELSFPPPYTSSQFVNPGPQPVFPFSGSNVIPTFGTLSSVSTATKLPQSSQQTPLSTAATAAIKSPKKPLDDNTKPLSEIWEAKGWECPGCYIRHDDKVKVCPCCETPQPGCSPISKPALPFSFGIPSMPSLANQGAEPTKFSFTFPNNNQFDSTKEASPRVDNFNNSSILSAADTSVNSSNTSSNRSSDFSFKDSIFSTSGSPSFPQFTSGSNISPFGNTKFSNDASKQSPSKPSIFGNVKSEPVKDDQKNLVFGNFMESSKFSFKGFSSDFQSNPANTKTDVKNDSDLEIIYVKEPKSTEQAEMAKKYRLPINFYDYENAKPCPGCRGCDEDTPLDCFIGDQSVKKTESASNQDGSNLFADAIATYGPPQTSWETGKASWSKSVATPIFQKASKGGDEEDNFATGEDAGGSDTAVFKLPTIQMPAIVEVKTGEEEEEPLFVSRAKVFLFSDKDREWKERGVGDFKLLRNPASNTYRMLLRRDKVLKIACNQRILPSMKFEPLVSSETSLTWAGVDFSEQPEKMGKFCIKFKNMELKSEFLDKVENIKSRLLSEEQQTAKPNERVKDEPDSTADSHATVSSQSQDPSTNLFAQAIEANKTPKANWESTSSDWELVMKPQPLFQKNEPKEGDDDAIEAGEDAGGSDTAVFKLPTIQMPDIVEVKTGEEEEEPLFVSRAKVFLFSDKDKEWKERGVGDFKILKNPTNDTYRMLLRRDKVLKIACNQRILPSMKFEPLVSSETSLTWAGVDFSEQPEKMGKFCIKFKNKEIKSEFVDKMQSIQSRLG